jgi:hypothetical protein
VPAPTQLSLYNRALRVLGETPLGALTDNRPARHLLDDSFTNDNAIETCLEQGLWNFAMRTVEASFDPDVTPDFGLRFAFSKPEDWVRTAMLSVSPYFSEPLLQYVDEQGYWYCDHQVLYIKYVSKDAAFGSDLTLWPESFSSFFAHYLALDICRSLTKSEEKVETVTKQYLATRSEARSKDAMNEPPKFLATSSWVASRRRFGGRGDRGNPGSLIG